MVGDSQLIYVCQRPLLALPLLLPLLQQPAPYQVPWAAQHLLQSLPLGGLAPRSIFAKKRDEFS